MLRPHSVLRPVCARLVLAASLFGVATTAAAQTSTQSSTKVPAPPVPAAVTLARISGIAFDSVAMKPLNGAIIQLVPANEPAKLRSATTDTRGSYAFDSVRVGTYLLGFVHPRLDSLGLEIPLMRVDVRTDGEVRAPVAIPSGRTLLRRFCGDSVARDSVGLFMGFVRPAKGDALNGAARVRTQWTVISLGSKGIERNAPTHVSPASAAGAFAICGVPYEGTFTARAFAGSDSSGTVELSIPPGRLLYRDLYVGTATRVASTPDVRGGSAAMSSTLKGNGALRGVVRSNTGRPVRGARITMWGSGRVDSTNASGQFTMQSLPAGSYTIETRAIGFLPKRAVVDIPDGAEGNAEVALDVYVPTVDTVRVKANRIATQLEAEFERRKKSGTGYFVDDAQLAKRPPMYIADALRGIPGISIQPGSTAGDFVYMRGNAGTASCLPAIFLNGVRTVTDNGVIDDMVNSQDVRAIEVYSRPASAPPQFTAINGCGSIVIWTGARRVP